MAVGLPTRWFSQANTNPLLLLRSGRPLREGAGRDLDEAAASGEHGGVRGPAVAAAAAAVDAHVGGQRRVAGRRRVVDGGQVLVRRQSCCVWSVSCEVVEAPEPE